MSGPCEEYISYVERELPELASAKDLVRVGIYRCVNTVYSAKRDGHSPAYFQISCRNVMFPKKGVLQFLRSHMVEVNQEDADEQRHSTKTRYQVRNLR